VSSFWSTWHRDIARGGALFGGVLAVGFLAHYMVVRVRERVTTELPGALRNLRDNLRDNLDEPAAPGDPAHGGARALSARWRYGAKLGPKQWVWIHNSNGSVHVMPAKGDSLEVTAVKSSHRSDVAGVQVVAVPYDGGVAICAVTAGSDAPCEPGVDFKTGALHKDVAVDFTVHVPRGVAVGATSVNGGVHVIGVSAPIRAVTVNGDVDAETAAGPVEAVSVNGSVRAHLHGFADTGAVKLVTVNGSVTAELPGHLDADVEATAVTGSIQSDYPLTATGRLIGHKLRGTLGSGGRAVSLHTVNGSITLKKLPQGAAAPGK
jgi:hypothetical protein